jgi:DNA-3-methyladenine glycosylase I
MKRCSWCEKSEIDQHYHDTEWGVPVYDDRLLFEMLILEGAQAGVSWHVVLQKRARYKKVFADFDATRLVKFTDKQLEKRLQDPGIIRNRLKVFSVRTNAAAALEVASEFGSFSDYIWQFTDGRPRDNKRKNITDVPSKTAESDAMSKDLKKRGFKFVGSTICYAYMQGIGMVNDHVAECFRYREIRNGNY